MLDPVSQVAMNRPADFEATSAWFAKNYHATPDIFQTILGVLALCVFVMTVMIMVVNAKKHPKMMLTAEVGVTLFGATTLVVVIILLVVKFIGTMQGEVDLKRFNTPVAKKEYKLESITVLGKELRVVYDNGKYADVSIEDDKGFIVGDSNRVECSIDGFFGDEWFESVEISEDTAKALDKAILTNLTIYLTDEE